LEKGSKSPISGGSLYLEAAGNTLAARGFNPSQVTPALPLFSANADLKGNYQFLIPAGNYRLTAAAEGFKKLIVASIPIGQNVRINFFLEEDGFALPEQLVSAKQIPKTQVSHEALSKREVTEVPGTQEDVLKVVQNLPGVVTSGSINGQLLVRGSGPNDNQFYVDNIPVGFPYHFGIVSSLDSSFIGDIDFYAGGFGPQFQNSMGGLVDMTQNDPRSDRWGFRADVNLLLSELEVEGPVSSNSSLSLSGRLSYINLFVSTLSEQSGNYSFPDFGDYQVKYSYNPSPREHWDFVALGSADTLNGFILPAATVTYNDPDFAGAFNVKDGYNNQGINLRDNLDAQNTIINTLYHTNSYLDLAIGPALYENNSTEDFGEKFSLIHEFDPDTSLSGGVQYDHYINSVNAYFIVYPDQNNIPNQDINLTTAPKFSSAGAANSDDFSAYVDQKFKAFEQKLEVSVGARMDYVNSNFTAYLTPRVSAAYHLTGDTTVKASYGYFDEAPDRIMGAPYLDANLGSPHLAPEQSIDSILGVEQILDSDGLLFRVEAYEKDFSSLIVVNPAITPGMAYLNTGTGYAQGIEFFLRQPPTCRFFGWIAYALSTSQRQDAPGSSPYPFDYDEPNAFTAVGNYKITPQWDAGVKVLYSTGLPYTPILGSAGTTVVNATVLTLPEYGPTDSARVPDYARMDISTSFTTVNDTWEWKIYLDIVNVFNTQNVTSYYYNPAYTQKTAEYDLPLLPYLGIEVKY
jgi:hypothetical protein